MLSSVHSDRSGRIVLAADYGAAMFDGAAPRAFGSHVALPDGASLIPLADRGALGLDRTGAPRPLGAGRFAVGAVLPPGYVRLAHPASVVAAGVPDLAPRAYAAVAADERGALQVAARRIDDASTFDHRADAGIAARITEGLRARPSNRLVRQLARCAKDFHCRAATNAFGAWADCAVPVAAPANEHPPALVSFHGDAMPTERAAFHATADEVVDLAAAHLEGGGTQVSFGRACEGEPLLVPRVVEPAIAGIRERTHRGTIHLESNGSVPAAVGRLARAGLDTIGFRIASARPETYERIHRPAGYRLTDVRASIAEAIAAALAVAVIVLVLPGLTDRERELDEILSLAGDLPAGSQLVLRDLGADAERALALVPSAETPLGMERFLERIASDAAHLRMGTLVRPLARV